MDHPFLGSFWNQPSNSRHLPAVRGIPVQPVTTKAMPTPPLKAVSIPVHFVETEARKSASALKIQKAVRGFLVSRSMKSIATIKREVEEIERRVSQSETVELIRKDAKERLKVNETLMALLFKLDSIRGFDAGVRDCRKAVIKKAIALQEKIDCIVSVNRVAEAVNRTLEITDSAEQEANFGNQTLAVTDSAKHGPNLVDQTLENDRELTDFEDRGHDVDGSIPTGSDNAVDDCSEKILHCLDASVPVSTETETLGETKNEDLEETVSELGEQMDVSEQACDVKQTVEEQNTEASAEEEDVKAERRHDNKGSRELLGKMMEDSEKMMSMMRQLYERNEVQTRMLRSLTQRVEQLEKAFVCDKLRRRKKRQSGGTTDEFESNPDQKKCGKK